MIVTIDAPRAFRLPARLPSGDGRHDLLHLMALRELEDAGPLTGSEALNALAALMCSFDLSSPGYALLHELRDAGLLSATLERPPRYAITDLGRSEAERLATRCWPSIRDVLVNLNVCLGCLAPRAPGADGPPRAPALRTASGGPRH
jgi:DNA-binding PadR family transcriptional regulator